MAIKHKIHYGLHYPVCAGGKLPKRSVSYLVTPAYDRVTCKRCRAMHDKRDKQHVLHLKKNLR